MALPFFACENEIVFSGNEKESKMVINGFLSPDSIVKIHISKSKFFLENDSNFESIANATAQLWINGELKGNMQNVGKGYYTFNYTPKSGDKIKILASSDRYKDVYFEEEIPRAVPILAIDTFSVVQDDSYSVTYQYDATGGYVIDTIGILHSIKMNVKVTFKDSMNFNNYYLLDVKTRKTYSDGTSRTASLNFYSEDIVFGGTSAQSELFEESFNEYYEFNDDLINGKTYTFPFVSYLNSFDYLDGSQNNNWTGEAVSPDVKQEIIVELISVSKAYYLYLKSLDAIHNSTDFFSEPIQVYSNVIGGIGLVGGYNIYSKTVLLPLNYSLDGYY